MCQRCTGDAGGLGQEEWMGAEERQVDPWLRFARVFLFFCFRFVAGCV